VDLRHYEHGSFVTVVDAYLGGKDADDSLVSPIVARKVSFFPPTLVVTSERDGLKTQGVPFYDKMVAAGVKAQLFEVPQAGHLAGFWAEGHAKAEPAVDQAVKFILAVPGD
jgi:acetyl esterase/lipase